VRIREPADAVPPLRVEVHVRQHLVLQRSPTTTSNSCTPSVNVSNECIGFRMLVDAVALPCSGSCHRVSKTAPPPSIPPSGVERPDELFD
jgi:hypothetical protein